MPIGTASEAVKSGADYYRLRDTVTTPFPTYDFDASCVAVQIGPDSDIAGMTFNYLDPNAAANRGAVTVEAGAPLLTRIDAIMDQKYPPPGSSVGKITGIALINIDSAILPSAKLDVFFFFKEPGPSFASVRKNDYQRGAHTFLDIVEERILIRPFYGRFYFDLQLQNQDLANSVSYRVLGHRFDGASAGFPILLATGALAPGAVSDDVISGRRYDAIEILATGAAGEALGYALEISDRCCSPSVLPSPGPH